MGVCGYTGGGVLLGNRLRVLQILPNFGSGGAERMAAYLIRTLDRTRYEVAAISLFDRTETDVQGIIDTSGVRVWYLGKHLGPDLRMYARVGSVLRSYRPHVIHTHKYVLKYLMPFVACKSAPVWVHTVHSLATKEVDRLGQLVNRVCFARGVVPVAIAVEVARSLERLYGIEQTVIIPNGVPVEAYGPAVEKRSNWRISQGFAPDDVIYVCVASLSPQKNHALLLEAFAKGLASDPRAHLVLAGDGPLKSGLEASAVRLGIGGHVRFLGLRQDIPDILNAADVFVLASDWEGNPLSVMEAMAAGKPVVATAVGGVPELVDPEVSGILVPPRDVASLSQALVRLMDPELRRKMGERGRTVALSRFGIERMARSYEELYERLSRNKGIIPQLSNPGHESF